MIDFETELERLRAAKQVFGTRKVDPSLVEELDAQIALEEMFVEACKRVEIDLLPYAQARKDVLERKTGEAVRLHSKHLPSAKLKGKMFDVFFTSSVGAGGRKVGQFPDMDGNYPAFDGSGTSASDYELDY